MTWLVVCLNFLFWLSRKCVYHNQCFCHLCSPALLSCLVSYSHIFQPASMYCMCNEVVLYIPMQIINELCVWNCQTASLLKRMRNSFAVAWIQTGLFSICQLTSENQEWVDIYSLIASPLQPVTTPPSSLNCFLRSPYFLLVAKATASCCYGNWVSHQCAGSSHLGELGADRGRMDDSTES